LKGVSLDTCRELSSLHHADGTVETEDEERQCLDIRFGATDAKALENLTRLYLGHQMLLIIAGEAVFAPVIRQPISGETIRVTAGKHLNAQEVKSKLDALVAKP
jgi:preprotein translocase subunit SecD